MVKGCLKKRLAVMMLASLMGCMTIGTTAMAATKFNFKVAKGEYETSGTGRKENHSTSFSIMASTVEGDSNFFIAPYRDSQQVGVDVTINRQHKTAVNVYYLPVSKDETLKLMGFYDELQNPVSDRFVCIGTWTP